jgi:CMP-N-acetylneuraminic acid synthetase
LTVLAVVPARGGSRGIPRKNVRPFLGRPLIAWTIEVALASGACERVVVSTDDEEIADVARREGAEVPFVRPTALAEDTTPTAEVARHAVDRLECQERYLPSVVLVLEPTSPARRPSHVREAARRLTEEGILSLVTVSRIPHHYVSEKQLVLRPDGRLTGADGTPIAMMRHRRQELPERYSLNGLVFGCRTELLLRNPPTLWDDDVHGYVIDRKFSIDLDDPGEWQPAELHMRELLRREEPE